MVREIKRSRNLGLRNRDSSEIQVEGLEKRKGMCVYVCVCVCVGLGGGGVDDVTDELYRAHTDGSNRCCLLLNRKCITATRSTRAKACKSLGDPCKITNVFLLISRMLKRGRYVAQSAWRSFPF